MNCKIKITEDNQATVARIADDNGMNKKGFNFSSFERFYLIVDNEFLDSIEKENEKYNLYPELTTEQFIQLFDKKETELEKWLRETKAKNLSLEELEKIIGSSKVCDFNNVFQKLEGTLTRDKAKILYNQWNDKPTELAEPHICKYCEKESFQDDEMCFDKPEWQPKRGDRVLVWDNLEDFTQERIFVTKIEGAALPILTVSDEYVLDFIDGIVFGVTAFKHMKPLPKEEVEEAKPEPDFKQKVVDLIESEIKEREENIAFKSSASQHELAGFDNQKKLQLEELLSKIKELN